MNSVFRIGKFHLLLFLIMGAAFCAQAIDIRSRDPYYSAVVIDADSGAVLWEDHAAAEAYPASMIKLMNLFVTLDDVQAGKLCLDEPVKITREAEKVGARQVWLRTGEIFPLEELLYAMMVHSANDAAAAVAIRVSGSKDAHAERMTAKARELGLRHTVFHNVHGLPPGPGQEADVTSALDMALLGRALLNEHPETLKYTAVAYRDFREGQPVRLTSSNKLLGRVDGCDGLKTGYFYAGGFSITATAERNGRRVIAVVMGCKSSRTRDEWAEKLLERGFTAIPSSR
jgi:D-alanyl-D-alanine carboxypeptidase (penicillin-binding protein 5/6)